MNKASSGNAQIEPVSKGPGKLSRIGQSCKALFCCIFMIGVFLNLALTGILLLGFENYHQVDHVKLYQVFESPKYAQTNKLLDNEKYLVLYGDSSSGIINFVEHQANIRSQQGVPVIMRDLQQSFIQKQVKQTKHFIELYLGQVGRGKHSWFIVLNNTETPQNQIQSIQKKYPHDSIILIAHQQIQIDGFENYKFPVLSSGQLRQFMQKDLNMDKKQIKQIFKNAQDKTAAAVFEAYKNNQQEKLKAELAKQALANANAVQAQNSEQNKQQKQSTKDKKKDSKKDKKDKQTQKSSKKVKKIKQVVEEQEQQPIVQKKEEKAKKQKKTEQKKVKSQKKDKKQSKNDDKKEKKQKVEKQDKKQKKEQKKQEKIIQQKEQKKQKSDDKKKKDKNVDKKQQKNQIPQPTKQASGKSKKQKKSKKSVVVQATPVQTSTSNSQQSKTQSNQGVTTTIQTAQSSQNQLTQAVQGQSAQGQNQAIVQNSL